MLNRAQIPTDCYAITKNDNADLPERICGLYVGGTGDVTVLTETSKTVTFSAVPVGTILPIAPRRVMSTGTTASLIVGFLS